MNRAVHVRVCRWYESLGISKSRLAERLGCDQSVISRIIAGTRGVGLRLAMAIERESADWESGPIKADEWVEARIPRRKTGRQPLRRKAALGKASRRCDESRDISLL